MAESLLRRSERQKKAPAYLEDYVCDPQRPPKQFPLFPESDKDDSKSVVSCASHRSSRSELRKRQRDVELAAKIQFMEIEKDMDRQFKDLAFEKAKVQLRMEKDLEDIRDEEEDLEEELLMGLHQVRDVREPVATTQRAQDWVNGVGSQPPSPVPSNESIGNRVPTPPVSVM